MGTDTLSCIKNIVINILLSFIIMRLDISTYYTIKILL